MTSLEDLKQGAQVKGIDPSGPVSVINVKWFGSDVVELTYRDQNGQLISALFLPATAEIKKLELRSGYAWLELVLHSGY
jgi:hypothetical protein